MRYREFGKAGIKVSELGFGAWQIGGSIGIGRLSTGYGWVEEGEAVAAIRRAIELGVNFFDTSDAYGIGRSEEIIGRTLEGKRDSVIIATKGGAVPHFDGFLGDFSKEHLTAACHRSLKRLRTDYIDIYQLHGFAAKGRISHLAEAYEVLDELKKRGDIRFAGVSIDYIEDGIEAASMPVIDSIQVIYNILYQEPRAKLFPLCKEKGIGIIARVPLMYGMLTDKYDANAVFPEDDWRSRWDRDRIAEYIAKRDRVIILLKPPTENIVEVALRFVLAEDAVSTVIPGIKSVTHLEENVKYVEDISLPLPLLTSLNDFR